ncbi:hypothetical protein AC579_7930 [Pseudocercospora musae]|uniref:Uncharacterized protein n=1 Tax=Pseudocercospora musae TaxID=113226 RepID=A0A139IKU9_9PEZI|nr:hypothetical protein AC579_7930 [Pseudocercospora musae]
MSLQDMTKLKSHPLIFSASGTGMHHVRKLHMLHRSNGLAVSRADDSMAVQGQSHGSLPMSLHAVSMHALFAQRLKISR